jgi:hypothetical protein
VNPKKAIIGIFIGALGVTSLIIINHFLILSRIYYRTSYNGNVNNLEEIIEKSELFDYQKNCKYRDSFGIVHNATNAEIFYHVDRNFINNLKTKIAKDHEEFHLYPFYEHHFAYSFEATNESLLYFTYNNNSIIKLEDETQTVLFSARESHYENNPTFWEGGWYLNFTLIPFSFDLNSTIQISDSILVKMNFNYDHVYGNVGAEFLQVDQFVCFSSNYQIIFVFIPLTGLIVA